MELTKRLINIATILIVMIAFTSIYAYQDQIKAKINIIVRNLLTEEIIIPDYYLNKRYYKYESVNETHDFKPTNKDDIMKIYYTVLNNGWNNFNFYCPTSYEACLDDVYEIANNGTNLERLNLFVSPYNNYSKYNTIISTSGEVSLSIIKVYTSGEKEVIDKYIDDTLEEFNITKDNVTVEDLKMIHNKIINDTVYDRNYNKADTTSLSNKASGIVKNGKAICSGYTDLYALFLDKLNIENIKIASEDHIWNYVYFDNKWTHTDLTWDDDENHENNRLNYFMIDTATLLEYDTLKHNFDAEKFKEVKDYLDS